MEFTFRAYANEGFAGLIIEMKSIASFARFDESIAASRVAASFTAIADVIVGVRPSLLANRDTSALHTLTRFNMNVETTGWTSRFTGSAMGDVAL